MVQPDVMVEEPTLQEGAMDSGVTAGVDIDRIGAAMEAERSRSQAPFNPNNLPFASQEFGQHRDVPVYQTINGAQVMIPADAVQAALMLPRDDGELAFSLEPVPMPERVKIQCLLHPDHRDRALYATLGMRTCPVYDNGSQYDLERHMEMFHSDEWKTIQRYRADQREQIREQMEQRRDEREDKRAAAMENLAKAVYASTKKNGKR